MFRSSKFSRKDLKFQKAYPKYSNSDCSEFELLLIYFLDKNHNNEMDWQNLTFALDYLASTGTTFSTEQRLAIQSSLIVLQNDNQFARMQFWGRIQGTQNDYYIVCGVGKDYIKDRVYFYRLVVSIS